MIGWGVEHCYIGCATDRKYVDLVCVMLSSLDDNGNMPEARLLVADFGLTDGDRDKIRRSAGRLGREARFFPLNEQSPEIVALPDYAFPLPLLGRFILPAKIDVPNARLVVLDADMIVNRSMRLLFETNMRGLAVAAVHDAISWREHFGRPAHPHYFNAGMMMIDVDRFNAEDLGARCMRRLAAYRERPMWLDQDAINEVLGDKWLPLDRRWNFFHAGDPRPFTFEEYDAADIIHFPGPKVWGDSDHAGISLFFRHVARLEDKLSRKAPVGSNGLTMEFAARCYEVLLGRDLESEAIFRDRSHLSPSEFVDVIVRSPEFEQSVINPLLYNEPLPMHPDDATPSVSQRFWAADRLPVLESSASRIANSTSWRELLTSLMDDTRFAGKASANWS